MPVEGFAFDSCQIFGCNDHGSWAELGVVLHEESWVHVERRRERIHSVSSKFLQETCWENPSVRQCISIAYGYDPGHQDLLFFT